MRRHTQFLAGFCPLLMLVVGCPDKGLQETRAIAADGNLEEAGRRYVLLARRDPANLAAWDGAVEIWCRKANRIDECLKVLDLELQLLGKLDRHRDVLSETLEDRARIRLEKGLAQSALMDLERARKAGPSRASVYVVMSRAYASLGAREAAVKMLEKAKTLDPANTEVDEVAKLIPPAPGFGGP